MIMDKLEKFISENAGLFRDSEPEPGHLERFGKKLDRESGRTAFRFSNNMMLKAAAVILIFITSTIFVFDLATNRISSAFRIKSSFPGLTNEMKDAMQYYDEHTQTRLGEFSKLACCGEEKTRLDAVAAGELNSLDANIEEIQQALQADPHNERLQAALIQNQQMKGEVLDNMISQMKKVKGEN